MSGESSGIDEVAHVQEGRISSSKLCPTRIASAASFHHGQPARDDFSSIRHPALRSCVNVIFSESQHLLFGIML
jgi:hypothetical protein